MPIPDSDVQVNPGAGTAEMHITDLPLLDYPKIPIALGPQWQTAFIPATLSLDVVWNGPVTQRVNVQNGTNGDHFAGEFAEDQATVTWSARNAAGFSFTANPGTLATTTIPGFAFAEVGHEQNGIFAPQSSVTGNTLGQASATPALPSANGAGNPLPASLAFSAAPPQAGPTQLASFSSVPALGPVLVSALTTVQQPYSSAGGGTVAQALSPTTPLGPSINPAQGYGAGQRDVEHSTVAPSAARVSDTTVLDQVFADLDNEQLSDGLEA